MVATRCTFLSQESVKFLSMKKSVGHNNLEMSKFRIWSRKPLRNVLLSRFEPSGEWDGGGGGRRVRRRWRDVRRSSSCEVGGAHASIYCGGGSLGGMAIASSYGGSRTVVSLVVT